MKPSHARQASLVAVAVVMVPLAASALTPEASVASTALSLQAHDLVSAQPASSASREADPTDVESGPRWPREISARPEASEWKQAEPVELGSSAMAATCTGQRVREWLRIRCTQWGIEESMLVSGTKANVHMWLNGRALEYEPSLVIEMPVRPGDRRTFQINQSAGRWGGSFALGFVSELWLESMPEPVIVFS